MEKVITCPVCFDVNKCFEDIQETFSSYLCFKCGFMSDSRYEIGSLQLIENLKKSPKLVRETITSLTEQLKSKDTYITQLEEKLQELQHELYFLKRNKQLEIVVEEAEEPDITHNVEEGLRKMGLDAEGLEELGDLLDEALGKSEEDDV